MNKILIIDDDSAICELIKINLELMGYNCFYSTDPIKGFALIKQENPSLVILDVMMGNVSGYDVEKKIRQTKEIAKTPIIMLTALSELNNKLESKNLFSVYHSKTKEDHGKETKYTFYQARHLSNPYHLDYVYAKKGAVKKFKILDHGKWICLSDHLPITFEIDESKI